jgi:hypothetical protein
MSLGKFHMDHAGRYATLTVARRRHSFVPQHIGNRHRQKTLGASVLFGQQPFAVQPAPVKNLVGVDDVPLRHPRHGCARLQCLLHDPALLRHRTPPSRRPSLNPCPLRSVHLSYFVHTVQTCSDLTLTLWTNATSPSHRQDLVGSESSLRFASDLTHQFSRLTANTKTDSPRKIWGS